MSYAGPASRARGSSASTPAGGSRSAGTPPAAARSRARTGPRPLRAEDRRALAPVYAEAFADSIEFCDFEPDAVRRQAERDVGWYFAGKEAPPLPQVSRVAVDPADGAVAGAMLVREGKRGRPVAELLFVRPAWQRRGLGRALLAAAVAELLAAGHTELVTGYALGNKTSEAFYHRLGFVDAPSEMVAQKWLRCFEHELQRHAPGELPAADRTRLEAKRDHWQSLVAAWEVMPEEERYRDRDE